MVPTPFHQVRNLINNWYLPLPCWGTCAPPPPPPLYSREEPEEHMVHPSSVGRL